MIMEILGAGIGAAMGIAQNNQRIQDATRAEMIADWNYRTLADRTRSRKAILEGNLSIGAMATSANNREKAIEAFQAESAGQEAAARSGASSGTPFYKLAADIALNRRRLAEMTIQGRASYDSAVKEAAAYGREVDMGLQQAIWGLQEADDQLRYVSSPVAQAMAIGTGVLGGLSMANSVNTAVVDITGKTVDELIVDPVANIAKKIGSYVERNGPDEFNAQPIFGGRSKASLEAGSVPYKYQDPIQYEYEMPPDFTPITPSLARMKKATLDAERDFGTSYLSTYERSSMRLAPPAQTVPDINMYLGTDIFQIPSLPHPGRAGSFSPDMLSPWTPGGRPRGAQSPFTSITF